VTGLIALEARRLWSRRLTRVLLLLILLGIIAAGIIVFIRSNRDLASARAEALRQRRSEIDSCIEGQFGPLPGENRPGFDRPAACRKLVGLFVEDPRFHYSSLPEVLLGTSVPAIVLGWVLAASSLGAEWHSGVMTTWLTWEPRRVRVLVAKALGAMLTVLGITVAAQLVLGLALLPAAALRGTMEGVGATWMAEVAGVVGRGAGAAAIMGLLGLGLASLGRNTAAALGAGFVYLAVIENLVRGLRPQWTPWLLTENAARFVAAGPARFLGSRTTLEAAVVVGAYAAAVFVAALVAFRARDIS
jgi:ABC-2 family transporter